MKSATVADLRNNFRQVALWIEHGEVVQITKHGRAFAQLTAIPPSESPQAPEPDIMAQLQEVWGERVFTAEEVAAMRTAELEGEEG